MILLASAQLEKAMLSQEVRAFSCSIACSGQWQSGPIFLLEKPGLEASLFPCHSHLGLFGKDIQSTKRDKLSQVQGLQPPRAACGRAQSGPGCLHGLQPVHVPNQSHGLQGTDGHSPKRTISAPEVVYAPKQSPPQEGKNKGGKL